MEMLTRVEVEMKCSTVPRTDSLVGLSNGHRLEFNLIYIGKATAQFLTELYNIEASRLWY